MKSQRDLFARDRYVVIRALLTDPLLGFLWRYTLERAVSTWDVGDPDVPNASCAYADPVMEHVLERLRPAVEGATGLPLHPTYSYVRLYRQGDALARHQDRPACEISVSLNVGQEPAAPWPLSIAGPNGEAAIALAPGDGLIYRGTECDHWREPYTGTRLGQVLLHYVDQTGPHVAWRFDKREGLGLSVALPL